VALQGRSRSGLLAHRVGVGLLALFVLAGLSGYLGVKSGTARASSGGIELEVRYGRVSRAGLATPLEIDVRRDGGFAGPVTLALDPEYFEMFDLNGIYPSPKSERFEDDRLLWEFEAPAGDELRVHLDARISPSRSESGSTTVEVLDAEGRPVVSTDVDTFIVP